MPFFAGVDIGGTNIKAGIVDYNGEIYGEADTPTGADRPQDVVFEDILGAVKKAAENAKINLSDIKAVGMGSPGVMDSEKGVVIYNNNLGWKDFHICDKMTEALKVPSVIENDADAAALGEVIAGSAKGAKRAIIVTLGTGVGVGIVINEKILRGSEFGHMVIVHNGRPCNCGRKGCFESYCSATGLINMTKEKIAEYPESTLAKIGNKDGVNGKTVFDAAEAEDEVAKKLIDEYLDYLACGLANLIDGLQPEVIGLSGGVAKQGEKLLKPLREKVYAEIYKGILTPAKIVTCTLGYKAGVIGTAMAVRDL